MGIKRNKLFAFLTASLMALSGVTAVAPSAMAVEETGGRWCDDGVFDWPSFDDVRESLDMWYPGSRSGRIWSLPSDDEVWEIWCHATNGEASMWDGVVEPSRLTLKDGTIANFRTTSKSGGYTIDFNTRQHTKPFKVHVE